MEVEHENGDSVVPKWSSNKCVALRSKGGSADAEELEQEHEGSPRSQTDQEGASVSVKEYPGVTHGGILWTPAVVKDFMRVMRQYYPREDENVVIESLASSREHSNRVVEDAHVEVEQVYA